MTSRAVAVRTMASVILVSAVSGLLAQAPPPAPAPPLPPKAAAPVDLTGVWVSVVTEDWQWRMVTPPKGDYASVPLNAEGTRVADTWTEAKDGMCEAYGVGGVMRMPGRLRISWQDDWTLKIETDAGQQTRFLRFAGAQPGVPTPRTPATLPLAKRSLQGDSVAEWQGGGGGTVDPFTGRGDGPGVQRWGALKVRTINMRPGWLRRNGVPYSEDTVVTEYFTRFKNAVAGDWFVVTTQVDDPKYLTGPFITSTNFKKEPDASKWHPVACK
jgi:hypothetical protein